MATGFRKPGEFCWLNILTTEPTQACEFFGKLFGWTYFDLDGMGTGVNVNGHTVGGMFDLHGANCPPGLPPSMSQPIRVENVDAMGEHVERLGGKVRMKMDILENGRMGAFLDPQGAEFDLWEPKRQQGTDADSSHHGVPCWGELLTTDVAAAKSFYTQLFGWTTMVMPMPGFDYTVVENQGQGIGGLMPILPEMGAMQPHWAVYLFANDTPNTEALATELGGQVFMPMTHIPTVGRIAGLASPQGVRFFVIDGYK